MGKECEAWSCPSLRVSDQASLNEEVTMSPFLPGGACPRGKRTSPVRVLCSEVHFSLLPGSFPWTGLGCAPRRRGNDGLARPCLGSCLYLRAGASRVRGVAVRRRCRWGPARRDAALLPVRRGAAAAGDLLAPEKTAGPGRARRRLRAGVLSRTGPRRVPCAAPPPDARRPREAPPRGLLAVRPA